MNPCLLPGAGGTNGGREDFYELDCLRGIAMCLVFGIHAEGIVNWAQRVPADAPL